MKLYKMINFLYYHCACLCTQLVITTKFTPRAERFVMSDKFFFKGRPGNKPTHINHAFSTNRVIKAGTEEHPLSLTVSTEERKTEVEAIASENELFVTVVIDTDAAENLAELDCILNKPESVTVVKTPKRNDPCSCDSGKKFKKCCG